MHKLLVDFIVGGHLEIKYGVKIEYYRQFCWTLCGRKHNRHQNKDSSLSQTLAIAFTVFNTLSLAAILKSNMATKRTISDPSDNFFPVIYDPTQQLKAKNRVPQSAYSTLFS